MVITYDLSDAMLHSARDQGSALTSHTPPVRIVFVDKDDGNSMVGACKHAFDMKLVFIVRAILLRICSVNRHRSHGSTMLPEPY